MRYDGPTVPATHTIIEKGMSPAEAVKLLAEFEKAARDKIIGSLAVENQLVNGQIIIERETSTRAIHAMLKLKINGHERQISASAPENTMSDLGDRVARLRRALADALAEVLLDELHGPIVSALNPRNL